MVDEVHLVWGWRIFKLEYQIVGHFNDVFPDVSTLALSAKIIPMILEYELKLLKLRLATQLYCELLDKPNITYMIREFTKPKHENLVFLVPDSDKADTIPKTIIFIDNKEDA